MLLQEMRQKRISAEMVLYNDAGRPEKKRHKRANTLG